MEELPCLDMDALSLAQQQEEEPKLIVNELLWTKICEQLNPAELDEVKSTLGSELIDGNEALHGEVAALAEILGDFQKRTDEMRGCLDNRPKLPENPVNKMLEQQIAFFIHNLRTKSRQGQPDLAFAESPRERTVIDHVMRKTSRPSSSRSCGSDFKPMTPRPTSSEPECCFGFAKAFEVQLRPGSSCANRAAKAQAAQEQPGSARSVQSAPELLSPMQESINLHRIETVAEPLRAALREEKASLLDQIAFLQVCMEEENDNYLQVKHSTAEAAGPTLEELRKMNGMLEKAWLGHGLEDPLQATFNKVPTNESRFTAKGSKPVLPTRGSASSKRDGRMADRLRLSVQDSRDESFLDF